MIAKSLNLEAEFFGQKSVILGKSGSGKSYTARVFIEEGIEKGVTFTVIDPQEAYQNLPGFYYVEAKKVSSPQDLGMLLAKTAKNVVISTKGMKITDQCKFVKLLLEGMRVHGRKGIRCMVIDECHKFAPEYDKTECKEEIVSMSQENRSDGLGFIAIEQRSQRLSKTILSQADYLVIHRMTAYRDLKAVENYLDAPEDEEPEEKNDGEKISKKKEKTTLIKPLRIIKKLEVGKAYFCGFRDEPFIEKVRKANTEHSGSAPKNLLTEDLKGFNEHINSVYRGKDKNMSDKIETKGEPVKEVIPSMGGFMDLVGKGAKMSVGLGVAGIVGAYASRMPLRLPYVSNRTLGSAATTIALYVGYRKIKQATVKDVMGYACAGAAVHTAGSLFYDVIALTKVPVPGFVGFAVNTMTGVMPVSVEGNGAKQAGEDEVDTNTAFA